MNAPAVRLSELLKRSVTMATLDPETEYREVTVRLWGKGVVERGRLRGASKAGSRRFVASAGQLVLSRIDARNGALGLVPEALDGAVVSNDFPLFDINRERLLPEFLGWLIQTRGFVALCQRASEGTTNRVRLQEDRFLSLRIPLPPLPEQRRVVARIKAMAELLNEAKRLRESAGRESAAAYGQIRDSMFRSLDVRRYPIRDLLELVNGRAFRPEEWGEAGRPIIRIQNLKYPTAPFNRFGGPVAPKHLVRSGDVLFAWSGQVVSLGAHLWAGDEAILNQHIFNVRPRADLLPCFIKEALNALVDEMRGQVRGLEMFHIRKQELEQLLFPFPAVAEQSRIVAELDKLNAELSSLDRHQSESSAALDALLPAVLDRAFRGEL